MSWFRTLAEAFRRWRAGNARALKERPVQPCCSRPPAGAGSQSGPRKTP